MTATATGTPNIGINPGKMAIFIDGANLHSTAKALDFNIDYGQLLKFFRRYGVVISASYYTSIMEDTSQERGEQRASIRPLLDWLGYNGYRVVTKYAKCYTDGSGRNKVKGNMDIELTIDALSIADRVDNVVLFSGDGDFRALVEALQRKGISVTVVSTVTTKTSMISDDLRRQVDNFIDISDIQSEIERSDED